MKNSIRYLPIKQKIIAISMVTSVAVVLLAAGAFFITQYSMNQANLVNSTATLARIVGVNSQAAMMFNDSPSGNEILAALAEEPQIISAQILKPDGQVFANYDSIQAKHQLLTEKIVISEDSIVGKTGHKTTEKNYRFYFNYLRLVQEIRGGGKLIGFIVIRTDLSQLYNALKWQALITGIVLLVVSLLGFLLISWMQSYISEPIKALNSTIQAISKKQDYSLRAEKYSNDELGVLTDGFNLMLEQIFRRDEELEKTLTKLKEANQIAEQASLTKSHFLASMSHEIRTPMNGVLGMINLMMQTPLDDQQLHYAKTIQNSGKTLLTIINDILDFSKVEANKLSLESVPFNPRETLVELGKLFAERIQTSGILFSTNISPDFPHAVIGDASRLNQILYNLLGNAIKFTARGLIEVNCRQEEVEKGKILLYFEVKDNGTGISQEKQKQLFNAFFQAHQEQDWMQGGTGLGLAIAKSLCEAMEGKIGVKSKLGEGSTFWFTAWLQEASISDLRNNESAIEATQVKGVAFDASILLAEDNLVNQDVAIGSLEYFGCQVTIANNGQEALNLFSEKNYDMILMDFSMPVMDGVTAGKHIRYLEMQRNLPETPIIALTAHAVNGIKQQCMKAGMNDYLSKPFSLAQLLSILEKWLPRSVSTIKSENGQDRQYQTDLSENQQDLDIAAPVNVSAVEELIDVQVFEQLRAIQKPGAPSLIKKMIEHYLQQTPKQFELLKMALEEGNTESLWKTAHSLKSSSAAIGANLMAQTWSEIENSGREGKLSEMSIEKAQEQYPEVVADLQRLMAAEP